LADGLLRRISVDVNEALVAVIPKLDLKRTTRPPFLDDNAGKGGTPNRVRNRKWNKR
jgi:hypothetical protein